VAASTTFGRKRPPSATAPRSPATTQSLSPQAEAFRASLGSTPGESAEDFSDWRRATRSRRWIAWAVGLALMSPGLLCLVLQAPLWVSIGLEVGGGVANAWLRRERRRQLRAITNWEDKGT
jgi:hypothetical protein